MYQQQTNEKLCLRVPAERGRERDMVIRPCVAEHSASPGTTVIDVLLAMSEMFSNAVGATSTRADVTVRLSMRSGGVTVKVFNIGPPFIAEAHHRDVNCERGRGLGIVSSLGSMKVSCSSGRELPATRVDLRQRT